MGKSRLLAEVVRAARERGVAVHVGECQSFGANIELRRLAPDLDVAARPGAGAGAEQVEAALREIDPQLAQRAAAAGRRARDRDRRQRAHARVRRQAAQGVARGGCSRSACGRGRSETPLLLVLEDCHWIDPLSRDLLSVLAREAARAPGAAAWSPSAPPAVRRDLGRRAAPALRARRAGRARRGRRRAADPLEAPGTPSATRRRRRSSSSSSAAPRATRSTSAS